MRGSDLMSKTKTLKIRCDHCKSWFNSPIYFGDSESFDSSFLEGNMAQCSNCGKMTKCNKENMKLVSEDGGFVGNETV